MRASSIGAVEAQEQFLYRAVRYFARSALLIEQFYFLFERFHVLGISPKRARVGVAVVGTFSLKLQWAAPHIGSQQANTFFCFA